MLLSKTKLNVSVCTENDEYDEVPQEKEISFYGCTIWQYFEKIGMYIGIINSDIYKQLNNLPSDVYPVVLLKKIKE